MSNDVYLGNPLLKKALILLLNLPKNRLRSISNVRTILCICTELRSDCDPGPWSPTIQDLRLPREVNQ